MSKQSVDRRRYLVAVILALSLAGIVVAIATKAIPQIMSRLMSQMLSEMPQKMMAQMKAEGINRPRCVSTCWQTSISRRQAKPRLNKVTVKFHFGG